MAWPLNKSDDKDANSCQIYNSHCVVNQILRQEMAECIGEGYKCGKIQRLVIEVERTEIEKSANQQCPNSKRAPMNFSHYNAIEKIVMETRINTKQFSSS